MLRKIIKILLCSAAICLWGAWSLVYAELKPGDKLPTLLPKDFEGAIPSLSNKIVIIDFWASWCGPCRKSFPELDKVYRQYKDSGVIVLAINVDEQPDAMGKFLKTFEISFPVIRDKNQSYVAKAGIEKMPTSLFVDRAGIVRFIHSGFHGDQTVREWHAHIQELSKEASR